MEQGQPTLHEHMGSPPFLDELNIIFRQHNRSIYVLHNMELKTWKPMNMRSLTNTCKKQQTQVLPVFLWGSCCLMFTFLWNVCTYSLGHCIVCPSTCGFWLPLYVSSNFYQKQMNNKLFIPIYMWASFSFFYKSILFYRTFCAIFAVAL
jgi:hypothetical protein